MSFTKKKNWYSEKKNHYRLKGQYLDVFFSKYRNHKVHVIVHGYTIMNMSTIQFPCLSN